MSRSVAAIAAGLAAVLLFGSPAGSRAEEPAAKEKAASKPAVAAEAVFDLQEVSAFETMTQGGGWNPLVRGQSAECKTEPDPEVKAYPKLKSKRPLYGEVTFDASRTDPKAGMKFHFVLDASEEVPAPAAASEKGPAEKPPADKPPAKEAAAKEGAKEGSSSSKETAARPIKPPAPKYDRLYFDLNRDLDLTNDPVLTPRKDPPSGSSPAGWTGQFLVFDDLTVPFDHGPGAGQRPFRIMPRSMVSDDDYAAMYFVATVARKGKIRIGSREYEAVLAQPYLLTGRFDRPGMGLFLTAAGSPGEREYWWGADELCAVRVVDGQLYTLSATPAGDKLTVKPYRGDFGTFAVGPGKRDVKELSVTGAIRSPGTALPLGRPFASGPSDKACQHKVPVGDYLPTYLHVVFGRLRITISENYHSDGRPRDRADRPLVFGMKVRKDKPFVLDFANKPDVMFASPAQHKVFKPGDEVRVAAVLVDPALDFMIRNLDDSTRKQKVTYNRSDGKEESYERSLSLDPIVTITSSSGKKVAMGKMPFG